MTQSPADASRATATASRSGELVKRLATAAVGIPVLLGVVLLGGPLFTVVVALALAAAVFELCRAAGLKPAEPITIAAMACAGLLALTDPARPLLPVGLLAAFVITALVLLVVEGEVEGAHARWAMALSAPMYVGVLGCYFVLLRNLDLGREWVLLAIFGTFAVDTGAYAVGRLIGKRKLAPRISPGKTIAGAVGGVGAGVIAVVGINGLLGMDQPLVLVALLGAVLALAAEAGDLGESLLKRSLGVKDMGRLFPGHGGMLDRMDSLLFVAPVVYWGARWISG